MSCPPSDSPPGCCLSGHTGHWSFWNPCRPPQIRSVCMLVHAHTFAWGLEANAQCLLHGPPSYFGTRQLSEAGTPQLARLVGQQTPGILLPLSPQLGVMCATPSWGSHLRSSYLCSKCHQQGHLLNPRGSYTPSPTPRPHKSEDPVRRKPTGLGRRGISHFPSGVLYLEFPLFTCKGFPFSAAPAFVSHSASYI